MSVNTRGKFFSQIISHDGGKQKYFLKLEQLEVATLIGL